MLDKKRAINPLTFQTDRKEAIAINLADKSPVFQALKTIQQPRWTEHDGCLGSGNIPPLRFVILTAW